MSIQRDFNNNLFGVATLLSLSEINNSIKELGFNGYNELVQTIDQLKILIADCEDKNLDCQRKRELLAQYVQIKNAYDEAYQKEQNKNNKERKYFGIFLLCAPLLALIISFIACSLDKKEFDKAHHVGEYACPYCHSLDTKGFSLFYRDGGMPCNGDLDYNLKYADYTSMHCEHCGRFFDLYRKDWN